MSTFSQFLGGGIKSIARGNITIAPAALSGTATIAAVVTTKTMLTLLGFSAIGGGAFPASDYPRLRLTNSTTVTADRGTGNASSVVVEYEAVEFY